VPLILRSLLAAVLLVIAGTGMTEARAEASRQTAPNWTVTDASVGSNGEPANNASFVPSLSDDGRYIAFDSAASNLVPNDTNGQGDVFVRDVITGQTELISRNDAGIQGNLGGETPSISGDGRFVAYSSRSTNLTAAGVEGIFVYDRETHTTELDSISNDGQPANSLSVWPAISEGGRFVAFYSYASNLVSGDTNGKLDLFIHDRQSGTTERLSLSSDGNQVQDLGDPFVPPSIDSDGRLVAFSSGADDLVVGDTNGAVDAFLRDRQMEATLLLSSSTSGSVGNGLSGAPGLSADGRFAAFASTGTDLVEAGTTGVNVFIRDLAGGSTEIGSLDSKGQPEWGVGYIRPALSNDGRFLAFGAHARRGGIDRDDIFLRDRTAGVTAQVNIADDGTPGNAGVLAVYQHLAISGDGHSVAFASTDSNLVPGDSNGSEDVFVYRFAGDLTEARLPSPSPTLMPSATPVQLPPTGGLPGGGADVFPVVLAAFGTTLIGVASLAAFKARKRNGVIGAK
jgi:TolB protein